MKSRFSMLPKEIALAQERHDAEVRYVIKRFFPDGDAALAYFIACEDKRGKDAVVALRNDVRKLWQQMAADRRNQPKQAA